MNELMLTLPIERKEYNGQAVVTLKDIDTMHQKPEGSARKRFNDNKKHFIEGIDYYRLSVSQLSEIRTAENQEIGIKNNNGGYVFTQTGYLMIVKSFTDDLSWAIQRKLVNGYFAAKLIELTFMGTPVTTLMDAAKVLGIPYNTLSHRFTSPAIFPKMHMGDALLLEGKNLAKFKAENARCYIPSSSLWILSASGFEKLKAAVSEALPAR